MPKSIMRESTPEEDRELDRLAELAEQDRDELSEVANRRRLRLESLGAMLRAAREDEGLSLADLSTRCGIDAGNLSKIENGRANVTVSTLDRYTEALGRVVEFAIATPASA